MERLKSYAVSLGFERVGIAPAQTLLKDQAYFEAWVAEGRAGEMHYLEREPARRAEPKACLPEAKSVIALALNYFPRGEDPAPDEARVARYAWGGDYHRLIGKKLAAFVRYTEALAPDARCRTFVDTGPLLERAFAQQAGLGFIGKNTMLITRGLGSWVFLAHVITSLELPPDAPDTRTCGTCRLCLDACPTGALDQPYSLDARKCISYQTIENRGPIDPDLRSKLGGWIFGCDICQDVCPHNTRVPATQEPGFAAPERLTLGAILSWETADSASARLGGTAMTRAGREGLVRNACVAAANLRRQDLKPALERLAQRDPSPLIREHASWALERLSA